MPQTTATHPPIHAPVCWYLLASRSTNTSLVSSARNLPCSRLSCTQEKENGIPRCSVSGVCTYACQARKRPCNRSSCGGQQKRRHSIELFDWVVWLSV